MSFFVFRSLSLFLLDEGEVVFLLCDRVHEGIYMTLLLIDDKTFKNIRCYYRSRFPIRIYACVVLFRTLFFDVGTRLTIETRKNSSAIIVVVVIPIM